MSNPLWNVSDLTNAKYLGMLEFQDNKGEFHFFDVMATDPALGADRLVFGGACNVGFLESGHIHRPDCETEAETMQELLAELETYYNDGPQYVTRIICNDRM